MFDNSAYDGHEQAVFVKDEASGLQAIIALHDSALGPAFGGCRMQPYADTSAALTDALRLSRGMTYKAAICELPYGGGKSVILGDPRREKSPELLRAMGRAVESLQGRYIVADDVGTTLGDLAVMREVTAHTAGATEAAKAPLAVTGYGVLMAIEALAAERFGRGDLEGLRVAIQGLGNVGMPLAGYLAERGARLVVTDVDDARMREAHARFGAQTTAPDAIFDTEADVFAPCALGSVINDDTVARLRVRAVCGGANNQLAGPRHDSALAARGIDFVPDYLVNAGGVIDFHMESIDDRPAAVLGAVERIRDITRDVLARAASSGETALEVADTVVQLRIRAARKARARNTALALDTIR